MHLFRNSKEPKSCAREFGIFKVKNQTKTKHRALAEICTRGK